MRVPVSSKAKLFTFRIAILPFVAALAVGMVACNASSAASAPAGPAPLSAFGSQPPAAAGTKQVEIRDPNLNNMVAYTLTIPATWNFQGAVLVDPSCGAPPTTVAYRVWSDDLKYGIQRMPEISWYTPSDPHIPLGKCKTVDALNSVQYAGMVMPTLRPNSRLVGITAAPQADSLAAAAQRMESTMAASAAQMHMPASKFGWDAKELRIEYNLGSQAEEEFLQVLETTSDDPANVITSKPGQVMRSGWAMNKHTTVWIVSERAPKGQLDAARSRLEAIRSSLTVNPAWDQAMSNLIRQRGAAAIQGSWKTFNTNYKANQAAGDARIAQGQQFISNMQAQGEKRNAEFAAYEDARSRHTADVVDSLLDRQYYVNPSNGQTSTISTTYSNNWSNGAGDHILSDIQGYDPNGYVQGNWTQLQPIKH